MICIYHNDLDGKCAAAIVKKFITKDEAIRFIKTDYKDPIPDIKFIDEIVVIVDFSYKPDDMQKIIDNAKSVIWIDHHVTARDYPYQYLPGLRSFEEKGFSGCELAWKYFSPKAIPLVVSLVGDYDKWALKLPDSKAFHAGMKIEDDDPEAYIWVQLLDSKYYNYIKEIISNGNIVLKYRDNYCNNLCRSFGYETTLDGIKCYVCNQYMFGSGGFGKSFYEYPICIAYIHDGEKFTVSLYSETVDVGQIVRKYGGGGHAGAAGMVVKELPWGSINGSKVDDVCDN